MRPYVVLAALGIAAAASSAAADDKDLDLIPDAVMTDEVPKAPSAGSVRNSTKAYVEEALTFPGWWNRFTVPPPAQAHPDWKNRVSLDLRTEQAVADSLTLTYSGRLNLYHQEGASFESRHDVRHDLRELYGTWRASPESFLDIGRINLKSGVALGFNPTDFFKSGAVIDRISEDPSVLRETRLGTLVARGQTVWEGGAATLAYAPDVHDRGRAYATDNRSFDPGFDRTNAEHRFLAKTSLELAKDFSPELLLYREADRTKYGLNLTRGVGDAVTVYGEWAAGRRASLVEEAYRDALKTGLFNAGTARLMPGDRDERIMHDVAFGASYATASKVTTNLEYHFHEAGMSRQDWRNWFDTGRSVSGNAGARGQLWQIRNYAVDRQEPLSQHSIFLRSEWQDAFVRDLTLSGLANVNAYDRSTLLQLSADYHYSDAWTFGLRGTGNVGTGNSERGSATQFGSVVFKAIRYF
jgi:hypothetical protein